MTCFATSFFTLIRLRQRGQFASFFDDDGGGVSVMIWQPHTWVFICTCARVSFWWNGSVLLPRPGWVIRVGNYYMRTVLLHPRFYVHHTQSWIFYNYLNILPFNPSNATISHTPKGLNNTVRLFVLLDTYCSEPVPRYLEFVLAKISYGVSKIRLVFWCV